MPDLELPPTWPLISYIAACLVISVLSADSIRAQSDGCPVDTPKKAFERGLDALKSEDASTSELEETLACLQHIEKGSKLEQSLGASLPLVQARALDELGRYAEAYRVVRRTLEDASDDTRDKGEAILQIITTHIAESSAVPAAERCRMALNVAERHAPDRSTLERFLDGPCREAEAQLEPNERRRIATLLLERTSADEVGESRCQLYRDLIAHEGVPHRSSAYQKLTERHASHCGGRPTSALRTRAIEEGTCPVDEPSEALDHIRRALDKEMNRVADTCLKALVDVDRELSSELQTHLHLQSARLHRARDDRREAFRDALKARELEAGGELVETLGSSLVSSGDSKACAQAIAIVESLSPPKLRTTPEVNRLLDRACLQQVEALEAHVRGRLRSLLAQTMTLIGADGEVDASRCQLARAVIQRPGLDPDHPGSIKMLRVAYRNHCDRDVPDLVESPASTGDSNAEGEETSP